MHNLFISYSSDDRGWAQVLEQKLSPLDVYRDKTRLTAAQPYQDQLFRALEESSALLIIWSTRVKDKRGAWREWVITEREHFRAHHPKAPIIYILLDDEPSTVDAHFHKLDDIQGRTSPSKIPDAIWDQLVNKIKTVVLPERIEVDCYVLACTLQEFVSLKADPNLEAVLQKLQLKFDDVAKWYGDSRAEWRPAGAEQPIRATLGQLEGVFSRVLTEDRVPRLFRNKQVVIKRDLSMLWETCSSMCRMRLIGWRNCNLFLFSLTLCLFITQKSRAQPLSSAIAWGGTTSLMCL